MVSSQQVEQHRAEQEALVALAVKYLRSFFALNPTASSAELKTFYTAMVHEFGSIAASQAASFYDQIRSGANVPRGFKARPADPVKVVPREQVGKVVDWTQREADIPVADTAAPAAPKSRVMIRVDQAKLESATQRLVLKPARVTITDSVNLDKVLVGYARIPTGDNPCAFCLLLASRGPAYASEHAALYKGMSMDTYHDDCYCVATPIFKGDKLPEGYDPKALGKKYAAARNDTTDEDIAKVLARNPKLTRAEAHTRAILSTMRSHEGIS